jgi:surface carbohydrate biosynthesis protein
MRIHLLCDQKWRDLPNLTALKLALEKAGHRVLLSTTKDAMPMIGAFRPHCVVLNHLFATRNQRQAAQLKSNGIGVVILPTEGAARPELRPLIEGEFADFSGMDMHLAWSEIAAQGLRGRWNLDAEAVPALGCSRFDFYTPRFAAAITPRDAFCRQHGLDPARQIVTWATAFNQAERHCDAASLNYFVQEAEDNGYATCYRRIGIDPTTVPQLQAQERNASTTAFLALVAALPDVQFVIRPHPAESRDFYQRELEARGVRNVRFCRQDYIWNVLNASSVHLHRHCTTAVEAWMWDKPTIEMAFAAPVALAWPDREAGSDTASSADGLINLVRGYLAGGAIAADRRDYRRAYIHAWFGPADGRRCDTAALLIEQFLQQRVTAVRWRAAVKTPVRQVATAVVRYALGLRPNDSLRRPGSAGARDLLDKQITRHDVRAYGRLIAPAMG